MTLMFGLAGVGVCGLLALFRPTRVIAVYLASIAVCSVGVAFALAAAGLFGAWLLYPYPGSGGDGQGLTMAIWGLVGLGVGGLAGAGVGIMLAHRLTRGRPLF
ncbi:hypothetical protein [Brevundimonas sp.]|uniref:hypothetical protein n=1 Tax=Brevundimonas sp. TaxID=1871086 RepID=UPI002D5BAD28|nr:hypothetical protein [Brevundimonas sp.]HYC98406.1 hypothetical protein [Brevundimonas sp.]